MKITKRCCYCGTNYNLLPTVLVTPLYGIVEGWPYFTAADMQDTRVICTVRHGTVRVPRKPGHWHRAGFRIAFKLWNWHLGWEIHYG